MRAVSTTVDVVLFCLLLSASAVTLVVFLPAHPGGVTPRTDHTNGASSTVKTLLTVTKRVNYTLAGATQSTDDGVSFATAGGPGFQRNSYGTLASLLADATVGEMALYPTQLGIQSGAQSGAQSNTQLGTQSARAHQLLAATSGYTRGVRSTIPNTLRLTPYQFAEIDSQQAMQSVALQRSITAIWQPYPDARLRGRIHIGSRPPPTVDVHAARVAVSSGIEGVRTQAIQAARTRGYAGVAHTLATAIVRHLFPVTETTIGLHGDYPVDALTAQRYRRVARVLGAPPPNFKRDSVRECNAQLIDALTTIIRSELATQFSTPMTAARAISIEQVHITVRTWSP